MGNKNLNGSWYIEKQLNFDKKLIGFRYKTIKAHIQGPLGLELGSADGQMTKYLVNDFDSLTSVDGSKELLEAIPNYGNNIKIHSFFEHYEPNQKFNSIIMEHILEHVANPIDLMTKAKEWLAPGGVILIGVPNALSIHRQAAVKMKLLNSPYELNDRDHQVGHKRVYSLETLKKDILKAGLKIINTGGVYLKPLSNKQMEDNWTNEMIEGFYELGKDFPDLCAEIYAICKV